MKLKITVDGKVYEVEVEASEPEAVRPAPVSALPRVPASPPAAAPPRPTNGKAPPAADGAKVCRSPIAGTVVRVLAQPGQAIQVGDVLLVLEAMKMETNITAPVAAKVSAINAKVGEAVQSGQVVAEFE
ncbi:MAG: biotin/lipoyl-containing protein [Anaeromyxobacter sp.]